MIDIDLAISFLNEKLWSDEAGAFKEAITIEQFHQSDNYLAWLVMRKHDPDRALTLEEGLLKDYIDPRWCILAGDVENFVPGPLALPDYLRYADWVALQFLYLKQTKEGNQDIHFGVLNKLYGMRHEGFIYDRATPVEAYTMYKLCLFSLCSVSHNQMGLAKELLETVSEFQVREGDELGGVKTEYIPPEWEGMYPQLLRLANCETTSLAILAQERYTSRRDADWLMTGGGIASGIAGPLLQVPVPRRGKR